MPKASTSQPKETPEVDTAPLQLIASLQADEGALTQAVADAIAQGYSWSAISTALGDPTSATRRKYLHATMSEYSKEDLEEILGELWLYISWRKITKEFTTEQKEIWADVVDKWNQNLVEEDYPGTVANPVADRWWR